MLVFWAPGNCAPYLKFSYNLLSDLPVYDAFLQTDPMICHFLLHFPGTNQQYPLFKEKQLILTPKRYVRM